ncbi:universal stress protein [Streptomyces sp. NPDC006655]|uniref:universal stress protein n=1 Tax=Streptomyces sp. NPDC006655 TaxID=3156898 RepID=UPI003454D8E4
MSHPVLAGVDGSESSLAAAEWAAREAALRGVALRLVHAPPPLPGDTVPHQAGETLRRVGERIVQGAIAHLGACHPGLPMDGSQSSEAPAETLLSAAHDAGLLVVGARGSGGFDGLAVGSVALRVAAAADRPVVVVPGSRPGGFGDGARRAGAVPQVVVGFDPYLPVDEVVDVAFVAARTRGAVLRVVQAWAFPAESVSPRTLFVTEEDRATWEDQEVLRLSDALRPWQEKYPEVTVRADVVLLHPAEALLKVSRRAGADLLVMGRGGGEGRLGPVTHAVLHHADCPVAVVPHAA